MQFGILERITLLNILPAEGDITTVRILKTLKESLGFTEDEIKEHVISSEDGRVTWKETGYLAEIPVGEKAEDIIRESLKRMDREKRLREEMIPLYERFCAEKQAA